MVSISDFGKTPEPNKAISPVGISLTDPATKPKAETAVVEQPKVEGSTLGEAKEKSDFVEAKENLKASPTIVSPIGVNTKAAGPDPAAILQGIMGKIGDHIGSTAKLKILLYGDPGSMKSSLAATAPNNLVADLEDGLVAAKFSPHGVAENVRPYPWGGFEDFAQLVGTLINDPEELRWIETFTVDSLSEVHRRGLGEVTEREYRMRPGSVNRYVAETDGHQENNERMLRMIRALRDMNRNLILIAHATTVEPKNKPSKTYPDFSEKLANKIEGMMDVVGYCEKKLINDEMVQVVRFKSDESIHCKARIPLPGEMINPTMAEIFAVWEESKNKL